MDSTTILHICFFIHRTDRLALFWIYVVPVGTTENRKVLHCVCCVSDNLFQNNRHEEAKVFVLRSYEFVTDTGFLASVILMRIVGRDKLILCEGKCVSC
jgi:hypothetical protein